MSETTVTAPTAAREPAPAGIDRDYKTRDREDLLAWLEATPETRVLVLRGGATPVENGALRLFRWSELAEVSAPSYLGRTLSAENGVPAGAPVIAVDLDDATAGALHPGAWGTLREVGAVLGARDASLFIAALALIHWHRAGGFCTRCGALTEIRQAGWSRRCPSCNAEHFPRTDPAIIVLVSDAQDRILLGSNALWKAGQYSLLAGFVEAGESLEEAVVREVFEEAGVRAVAPEYRGSQAWPLPRSLMLGYRARVAPDFDPASIEPDGEEILDLRWFSREGLRAEVGTLTLPGHASIARKLLDEWLIEDGGPDIDGTAERA